MNKLFTFVVAAAGGFVAGILLAPKSGKETREELKNKTMEYKGKAKEGMDEAKKGARLVKAEVVEGSKAVREIAEDAGRDVAASTNLLKNEVGRRANAIKKDVSDTTKDVKSRVK